MSDSRYQPASFRGVPFGVQEAELTTGRRTAKHEFPGKDEPFIEDMGRRYRTFTIEGFVVGDDYVARRDALLEALERAGPGELIHPTMGKLMVQVSDGVSLKESWNDRRVARFTIPFIESPKAENPKSVANQVDLINKKKTAAFDAAAKSTSKINLAQASSQSALLSSTQETFKKVDAAAKLAKNKAASALDKLDGFTKGLSDLSRNIQQAITKPLNIVYGFQDCIVRMGEILEPLNAIKSYVRLYKDLKAFYSNLFYQDNKAGAQQALNDAFMGQAIKTAVAGAACSVAAGADWDSRGQAEANREALRDMLSEIMDTCNDDELFAALADLRQTIGDAIPAEGAQLRDLRPLTLQADLPAVVVAARLYGSIALADDIVRRNNIRHPNRVPAGKTHEVIS